MSNLYVQAKRWQGAVGHPPIQSFVGAPAGQHATKGIFIASSEFSESAIDYAKTLPSQRAILIDGQRLAELMIEHNIGVSRAQAFEIKRVDGDYFADE